MISIRWVQTTEIIPPIKVLTHINLFKLDTKIRTLQINHNEQSMLVNYSSHILLHLLCSLTAPLSVSLPLFRVIYLPSITTIILVMTYLLQALLLVLVTIFTHFMDPHFMNISLHY